MRYQKRKVIGSSITSRDSGIEKDPQSLADSVKNYTDMWIRERKRHNQRNKDQQPEQIAKEDNYSADRSAFFLW